MYLYLFTSTFICVFMFVCSFLIEATHTHYTFIYVHTAWKDDGDDENHSQYYSILFLRPLWPLTKYLRSTSVTTTMRLGVLERPIIVKSFPYTRNPISTQNRI